MSKAALKKSDVPTIVSAIHVEELRRRGLPIVRLTISETGRRAAHLVSPSVVFNESNPRVKAYIKKWGGDYIVDINRTTQNRVKNVLLRGIEAGDGYERMALSIGHVFDVAEGSRAVMIARTEVHTASTFAGVEGYKQAGAERKEWQHSDGGDDPRYDHIEMDGQVVGIDEDFESPSGATASAPGMFGIAEEDINCQCGVLPVVDDKRLRPAARAWLTKFMPRLTAPLQRKMNTAMKAGFKAQRNAVMSTFESLAQKEEAAA